MLTWIATNAVALTVIIGLAGFTAVVGQIVQSGRHENRRIARRDSAARATLPLLLSALCEYAARSASSLLAVYEFAKNPQAPPHPPFDPPQPPAELVEDLRQTIEATKNKKVAEILARTLSDLQVLDTRMRGMRGELDKQQFMIDSTVTLAGLVYARAESLFDYARRETNHVHLRLEQDVVSSALNKVRCYRAHYPDVHQLARRTADGPLDPWWRRLLPTKTADVGADTEQP